MQSAWSFTGETGASDFVETLLSRILTLQGALSLSRSQFRALFFQRRSSQIFPQFIIMLSLVHYHQTSFSLSSPPVFCLFKVCPLCLAATTVWCQFIINSLATRFSSGLSRITQPIRTTHSIISRGYTTKNEHPDRHTLLLHFKLVE